VEQEMGESIHNSRDSMVVYMWYILRTTSRLLINLWSQWLPSNCMVFRHGSHKSIVQLSKCTKMQHSLFMLVSTKQELPYSGKFSRVLIFTVYADQLHSAKIKTSKF